MAKFILRRGINKSTIQSNRWRRLIAIQMMSAKIFIFLLSVFAFSTREGIKMCALTIFVHDDG